MSVPAIPPSPPPALVEKCESMHDNGELPRVLVVVRQTPDPYHEGGLYTPSTTFWMRWQDDPDAIEHCIQRFERGFEGDAR